MFAKIKQFAHRSVACVVSQQFCFYRDLRCIQMFRIASASAFSFRHNAASMRRAKQIIQAQI